MMRRIAQFGHTVRRVHPLEISGPAGVLLKVTVCIAGGTLGWVLAQL